MLASITLYGRETLSGRSCSSSGSLSSRSRIALLSSSRGSRGSRTASHSGESLHRSSDIIQQLSLHNILKRLLNLSNRAALDNHPRRIMSAVRLQRHRQSLRAVNSLWTFSSLNVHSLHSFFFGADSRRTKRINVSHSLNTFNTVILFSVLPA